MRERPSGTIRISADEYAIRSVLWPVLERFLVDYPEIHVDLTTDYGRTDIVRERYDAGVRRGQLVSKDMIALRIGPDVPMAVVATPTFLKQHGSPRNPRDLAGFPCINLRLPTHGELFPWQFRKSGKDIRITTSGQLVLTSLFQIREACLGGLGLAWLPHDLVASRIATGELVEVLSQWQKVFEPYHLYYPSRRQHSSAMAAFIAALQASVRE